jgi:hypothetical protein
VVLLQESNVVETSATFDPNISMIEFYYLEPMGAAIVRAVRDNEKVFDPNKKYGIQIRIAELVEFKPYKKDNDAN